MPVDRFDKVITASIYDPVFWATNPRDGELFCPLRTQFAITALWS